MTTLPELERLRPEWAELWSQCPEATPFQSPDWIVPWCRHLLRDELWLVTIRQNSRLAGVAPFMLSNPPGSASPHLLLAGTGVTDYQDVLLAPETRAECLAVLWAELYTSARWEFCDFQELRGEAALLNADAPETWKGQVTVQEVCPVLSLPSDGSSPMPARMREKLAYYRRRAERIGKMSVERTGPENLARLLDAFFELHRSRWAARGKPGVVSDTVLQEFHREVADGMMRSGMLRVYGLRLGETLAAVLYGFCSATTMFFYLSGFNPEFSSISPGTLLIGYAIEEAVREGKTDFDFLRGREAYKYLWGAKGRLNYRRRLWPSRT